MTQPVDPYNPSGSDPALPQSTDPGSNPSNPGSGAAGLLAALLGPLGLFFVGFGGTLLAYGGVRLLAGKASK